MEQPVPSRDRTYTEEEYLRISAASDIKYEFRHGRLIPHGGWERDEGGRTLGKAGGSAEHADVAVNLIRALGNRLAQTSCRIGNSDMRVHVPRTGRYNYPDVSVTCEPRVFVPPTATHTLVNPQVVVEVLSPSTADDDWTEKRADYLSIESLREYVLVSQHRPRVDTVHRRPDGSWAFGPWAERLDASIEFPSLGVAVPLAEVYAGVAFPPALFGHAT